jgi:hypothetical protein
MMINEYSHKITGARRVVVSTEHGWKVIGQRAIAVCATWQEVELLLKNYNER